MTVGEGGGLDAGGQRGESWDNCNRKTIKYLKIRKRIVAHRIIIYLLVSSL